ncbi:MAG: universal stress protein [Burkholderiales bacterium]
MFKHILIPTDGSKTAEKAVQAGIEFARDAKARVTALTAMPTFPMPSRSELMSGKFEHIEKYEARTIAKGEKMLERIAQLGKEAGVEVKCEVKLSDEPYVAIIDTAKRNGCDLIFMASHGRSGFQELLHGSQTHEILTKSKIPTLVYR